MTGFLLDVNVLIALVRETHIGHAKVKPWFDGTGRKHWATCPVTESGFVRVASNRQLSIHPVDVSEALDMLTIMVRAPGHHFWPADIAFPEAVEPFKERLVGHRQVTDAYLLGLAIKNKGRLVTLDRGIEALAGSEFAQYVTMLE